MALLKDKGGQEMAEQEETVINIDGTEYDVEDFDDKQKYIIQHIRNLQAVVGQMRFELDQKQIALDGFTKLLMESIEAAKAGGNGEDIEDAEVIEN